MSLVENINKRKRARKVGQKRIQLYLKRLCRYEVWLEEKKKKKKLRKNN